MPLSTSLPPTADPSCNPRDQYATPKPLVAALSARTGIQYTLDPAAAPHSSVAPRWYGVQHDGSFIDGLTTAWDGNVWLNMPYSDVMPWVDRSIAHAQHGLVQSVSCLVQNDCTTQWYEKLWAASGLVLLLAPRVVFELDGKPATSGARFASALFVLTSGPRVQARPEVELFRWRARRVSAQSLGAA